jgi:CHAD domain-containing protein
MEFRRPAAHMARSPDTTRELFDRLTRQARRTARTPDAAQVHNLRVAIRRFSQALTLLPADTPDFKKIHRKLKKTAWKNTMTLAGEVRDADIAIKLVVKLKPAGARALQRRLARRRTQREKLLVQALLVQPLLVQPLQGLTPRRRIEAPAVSEPPPHNAISDAAKRLFKRGARAESPKGLHRLRIAAKKLRYTLELLAPHTTRLAQIKRLQSRLGDINDYETARRMVEEESGGKKVLALLEDRQRKKIRQFRRYWKSDFDGDENFRRWMADLSRAGKRASAAGA